MNSRNNDCVLLLSGGMDSTLLAYRLKEQARVPICAIFDYGQTHKKEIQCAETTAAKLGFLCRRIPIPIYAKSALLGSSDIPCNIRPDDPGQKSTIVPHRNLIMLAIAASLLPGCDIFLGANKSDHVIYPDCRQSEFFEPLNAALSATYGGRVLAPLLCMTKTQIVLEYLGRGIPTTDSWSCYAGKEWPCGVCGPCVAIEEGIKTWKQNQQ